MPLLYRHVTDVLIACDRVKKLLEGFDWENKDSQKSLEQEIRTLFDVCDDIKKTEVSPSPKTVLSELLEQPSSESEPAGDDPFGEEDDEISNLLRR